MKRIVLLAFPLVFLQVLVEAQTVAPSGLTASTLSTSGILLNWIDNSTNETGFQIERSIAAGAGFTLVATTAASATAYISTGLMADTQYFYRVRAVNAGNSSDYTAVVAASTGLRRFLLDFGSPAVQTALTGWNNVTSPKTGTIINLLESTGTSSSLSLQITKDPSNGYGDYNTNGPNQPVLDYPVSAVSDSHYAQQSGGTYRLNGLDNSKAYNIRIFGSRNLVSDSRKTSFTINGQQQIFEASNNTSNTIVFTNLIPVSGTITIDFKPGPASGYGYLNVLDIVENSLAPQAPGALAAVAASSTQINVTWADASANEAGFQLERSLTSGTGFTTVTTTAANVTAYSDTGLTTATLYFYRVKAINAAGASAYTAEASAATLAVPPVAPTNLAAASSAASAKIDLTWVDASTNETGFQLERSLTTGTGFTLVTTTAANDTAYADLGLIEGTHYFYRVRAINAGGSSEYSAEASVTTIALPPVAPSTLAAVASSSTQINLTWVDASTNETGFQLERSLTTGTGFTMATVTPANATTFSDTGLLTATPYFYRVKAINLVDSSTYTAEVSASTLPVPPAAPATLTAVPISATRINLTWVDVSSNETGFQLERSLAAGTGFMPVANTAANDTTYSDASLNDGTHYFYRVKAINAGGSSAYTPEANATTFALPPAAPTTLVAVAASATQINLTWVDASNNEAGFQLERSLTSGMGYAAVTTTAANVTAYSDNGLSAATQYFYRVKAMNAVDSSAYTPETSVTTFAAPPGAPNTLSAVATSSSQINLTWIDASTNETGFQLERSLTSATGFIPVVTTAPGDNMYSDTSLTEGTHYFYRVKAINAGGSSPYSAEADASTLALPPVAPSTLTAVAFSTTQINLTWVDASTNETGFQLERSLTTGSDFTVVTTAPANAIAFSDAGLTAATHYFYRVKAINAAGGSAYSAEANASTLSAAVAQPYGQIFTESSFSSATRFPITGTGISRGANKLVLTGNPTMFASYIYHNDAASPFRYTCLENWKVRVRLKTPATLNGTSTGLGIGVQSVNTFDPYSTTMRWSWDTGSNFIYLYYKSTTSNQIVSGTKYAPAANTYYWVEVTRTKDSFTYTIFDGATGNTQLFTVTLTFPTFTAGNYIKAHNTGQFCIHQFGGTNNEVTNWEVSTTALKNADYIGLGDSNMHGMFATNNTKRWTENALTTANKSFNILAGTADRTSDMVKRLPEVIALSPKAVVLSIGRNDLANSVPLATIQSNIDYIINTLQTAGITVKLAGVISSNVNVSALQTYYNGKTNEQVNAYTATKSVSATTLNSSFNAGDGIHLNPAGNTAMSNLLLTILVPPTPPAAPGSLSASAFSPSQINLAWTDNSTNETGFQIERSLTAGTGFTWVATTAANIISYSSTGLTATTQYFYRVRSVNNTGSSTYTTEATATTTNGIQPADPSGLAASALSTTSILLDWTDNSTNETGFQIERSMTAGAGFTLVATTPSNVTSYISTGLASGTPYFYRVRAINGNNSGYTLVATASTGLRRFLIDFGSPTLQTSLTGWNNVTSPATGSIFNLLESSGSSSAISLQIIKDPSNGYSAYNLNGPNQVVLDYPVSATSDSHYAYQSGGTYRLSGLDNTKAYSLRLFGSRIQVSDSRNSAFTIGGQQQTLEAANNISKTIIFINMVPVSGTITMDFNVGPGSGYGYINVLDIVENSPASQAPGARAINPGNQNNNADAGNSGQIESSLDVYPNPVSHALTIKVNDPVQQKAVIQIIDLVGLSIHDRETETNQNTVFDVSLIASGLYVIKVQAGTKSYSRLFRKQD